MSATTQYDPIAKGLHWLMAVLIIGLWCVGLSTEALPKGDFRSQVIGLHKAFGVLALALVVVRLAWRATHAAPELPAAMPPLERLGAKLGHVALYGLMIALPAEGIFMSQAAGRPVNVFGFTLPTLIDKNDALRPYLGEGHELLAWALAFVLAVHVAAALRHHWLLKDDILRRMLPGRS